MASEAATTTVNRLGIRPGLSRRDFRRIAQAGFGDGMNAYAHSMAWFDGALYVRTTRGNFPFMRLTEAANVLIMPAIHSASISTKLVQSLGGATVIGPILLGLSKPVQICPLSASVSTILNMAMIAAYDVPAEGA